MSKTPLYLILLFVLLTACAAPAADPVTVEITREVPVEIEVTRMVEVETAVEVTRLVEVEVPVEVTRLVEVTAVPTPTPEPPEGGTMIGMNYVAEVEDNGGVLIQIARVVVANKADVPQDFSRDPSFDDVEVVGELVFIITNNSDQTISVYPDQGTVQINSELIDLFDYLFADFGDDISGDIPPGVQLIGGLWFGIKRNAPEDVNEITVRFNGPVDPDTFTRLGEDFEIVLDVSAHTFEPYPEELQ